MIKRKPNVITMVTVLVLQIIAMFVWLKEPMPDEYDFSGLSTTSIIGFLCFTTLTAYAMVVGYYHYYREQPELLTEEKE